jgi:hypothetical protein
MLFGFWAGKKAGMKRARFSEEQIIGVSKQAEGGRKSRSCAGGKASQTRLSTPGATSTPGWSEVDQNSNNWLR